MVENIVKIERLVVDKFIEKHTILVFKIRNSRIKSLQLAILEAFCLLRAYDPIVIKNPPMSDVKGTFALAFKAFNLMGFKNFFERIGYSNKVYKIDFDINETENCNISTWKGKRFSYSLIYIQDEKKFFSEAPDNREFAIIDYSGKVKKLSGYRGNGKDLGRRALPVEDCRMMVNLSMVSETDVFLDPFAGGGGIIFQAKKSTKHIYSADIDATLSPGLEMYGSTHFVCEAKNIVLDNQIDMLVTEVPFLISVTDEIVQSFIHLSNYLSKKARIVLMCSDEQKETLLNKLSSYYYCCCSFDINRKGTDVSLIYFTKDIKLFTEISKLYREMQCLH